MRCRKEPRIWRRFARSLLLSMTGVLSVSLTSCCAKCVCPEVVTPPRALTLPCEPPEEVTIVTNGDLLKAYWAALLAYDECVARYDALRGYLDASVPSK